MILTSYRNPDLKGDESAGDFTDLMYSKTAEIGRSFSDQKQTMLNTYLEINRIEDWTKIVQTSYDWALKQILEFQCKHGLAECEIISVNDMVFVFSKFEVEEITSESVKTYKYKIKQHWEVFRKPKEME